MDGWMNQWMDEWMDGCMELMSMATTVHYKHPSQMAICDAKCVNLQSADWGGRHYHYIGVSDSEQMRVWHSFVWSVQVVKPT